MTAPFSDKDIPELSTRPIGEKRYEGDLCKIDGVVHVYYGKWIPLAEINKMQWKVQNL